VQDGLIYLVDLRNGLYILRYRGPCQEELDSVSFLEGNSNVGDQFGYGPCAPVGATATSAEQREPVQAPATAPAYPSGDFGSEELRRD
jgi:hypothetical protein